jgi:DNA repair protein RadC
MLLGPSAGTNSVAQAAAAVLERTPLHELAWAPPDQLCTIPGIGPARAAAIAAAFELGRRAGWAPPRRGERVLDPARVYELMRHLAHAEREEFHVVLLDVRGRLIKTARVAEGSLTHYPVSPRDALREAVRIGAHGVVFVHNSVRGPCQQRRGRGFDGPSEGGVRAGGGGGQGPCHRGHGRVLLLRRSGAVATVIAGGC